MGAWIRFVLFGDGERELRRLERLWGRTSEPDKDGHAAGPIREEPESVRR
jgi:hypothetical protein